MKAKILKSILCLSLAVSMTAAAPASLWAAAQTGTEIRFTLKEAEVKNDTERTFDSVEYTPGEGDASASLTLTEADGTAHVFADIDAEEWNEPTLVDSYGFLYIRYKDKNGKEQECIETADTSQEIAFDAPVTMWVSTRVHIRKEADKNSESLKIVTLGEEWPVIATAPGWFKVQKDDITGYIYHSYLTEDKESVDAALKAQQEAEAAQAAAAQAAAQAAADAAAQAAAAQPQAAPQPQPVTEVSRQAYDDCDGSGHGYYEITYSDGSVSYEEY